MVNDDLVKCPLCGGFTLVDKALLAALNDRNVRLQLENYVAKLLRSPSGELAVVATGQPQDRDFNKDSPQLEPEPARVAAKARRNGLA